MNATFKSYYGMVWVSLCQNQTICLLQNRLFILILFIAYFGTNQTYCQTIITTEDVSRTTSSEEFNLPNIFPNPASHSLNIEVTGTEKINEIRLINAYRKPVLVSRDQNLGQSYKIDLSSVQPGIYFINVFTNERRLFKKILIRK